LLTVRFSFPRFRAPQKCSIQPIGINVSPVVSLLFLLFFVLLLSHFFKHLFSPLHRRRLARNPIPLSSLNSLTQGANSQPVGASVSPTRVSIGNVGIKYAPRGRDYSPTENDLNSPTGGGDEDNDGADVGGL